MSLQSHQQKIYGWEPEGAVPTYSIALNSALAPNLGDVQTQRALIKGAEQLCRAQGANLLSCALMVRDEAKRIVATLASLRTMCDRLVLLDTGSQDDTIELTKQYCQEHRWSVEIYTRPFDEFAASRNYLLSKCADPQKDVFLFLADCNDALVNPLYLRALCALHYCISVGVPGTPQQLDALEWQKGGAQDNDDDDNENDASSSIKLTPEQVNKARRCLPCHYFIDVEYRVPSSSLSSQSREGVDGGAAEGEPQKSSEPMVRLIRNNCGWRYSGPLHEVLWNDWWQYSQKVVVPSERFKVVQDKSLDDNGSQRRWPRDLALLDAYLAKHPNHPQALYYRAKTLRALGKLVEAIGAFQQRCAYPMHLETQPNQVYQAHYLLAECILTYSATAGVPLQQNAQRLAESSCWTAFRIRRRAEPLLLLHRLFVSQKDAWRALSVTYLATRLPTPSDRGESFDRSAYVDRRYSEHAGLLWQMGAKAEAMRLVQHAKKLAGSEPTPQLERLNAQIQAQGALAPSLAKLVQSQAHLTPFDPIEPKKSS